MMGTMQVDEVNPFFYDEYILQLDSEVSKAEGSQSMIAATTSLDDVLQLIQGWDPSNLRQRRVDLFVDPIPSHHGHFFFCMESRVLLYTCNSWHRAVNVNGFVMGDTFVNFVKNLLIGGGRQL